MQTVVAQGFGIGRAPLWQIRPLVEQGVVDIALEEFEADKLPIYAVLPPARFALAKTRSFLGLLAARIKRDCR
jgi:DNA-binding transcriptional LysR family regulator